MTTAIGVHSVWLALENVHHLMANWTGQILMHLPVLRCFSFSSPCIIKIVTYQTQMFAATWHA